MDAGSQTFAKLSAAKLLDSAIAAVAASPSTVLSVSCRAAMCAAISLSVMFQRRELTSHHAVVSAAGRAVVNDGYRKSQFWWSYFLLY